MALPLSQGVSQVSAISAATVPAAARFTGAAGAVAARLFVTGSSVRATASLLAASLMGFIDGTA